MKKRDTKWRTLIRNREAAFWIETGVHEASLLNILEDRDNFMKATLESRDTNWLNSLAHCRESFKLMAQE